MRTITTTDDLAAFCEAAKSQPYVTIDTEFLRERTYWSKLCLIQMALPGKDGDAVLVDPIIGEEMSMEPLYDLFRHEATVKVFHAARQDIEIIFHLGDLIPHPIFDTQIAMMAISQSEQIGYANLVETWMGLTIDKGARFTDWSRRPLTDRQIEYAIGDVTHLAGIFPKILKKLIKTGRGTWLNIEMEKLADPAVSMKAVRRRSSVRSTVSEKGSAMRRLCHGRCGTPVAAHERAFTPDVAGRLRLPGGRAESRW